MGRSAVMSVVPDPPEDGGSDSSGSKWSLWSTDSLLSIGSAGSVLSIGSVGSALSIGSCGSVLSIASAGSALSLLSIGSALSVGSVLSMGSRWSVLSIKARNAFMVAGPVAMTAAAMVADARAAAPLRELTPKQAKAQEKRDRAIAALEDAIARIRAHA